MQVTPDRKRQLERILSRQRVRTGLIGAALVAPVLGLLLVLAWPSARSGAPEWAEVIGIGTAATDDAPPRRLLTLLLPDGGRDMISAGAAETPGVGERILCGAGPERVDRGRTGTPCAVRPVRCAGG